MLTDFILQIPITDTLQNSQELLKQVLEQVSQNSEKSNMFQLITIIFGSGAGIWILFKAIVGTIEKLKIKQKDINLTKIENKYNLDNESLISERQRQEAFQQQIVNKFFEEYVKQNKWITEQFSTKFETLLNQLNEQKRLSEENYAAIDSFRKDNRELSLLLTKLKSEFDYKLTSLEEIETKLYNLLEQVSDIGKLYDLITKYMNNTKK